MLEETLREIWGEALGIVPTDIDENRTFFELGGYSLLAIELVDRINRRLSLNCPLNVLLEQDTLAKLLAHLSDGRAGEGAAVPLGEGAAMPVASQPCGVPEGEPFRLTDLQQAYWIGEKRIFQIDGPAAWYTEYSAPELDPDRLRWALDELVRRHPMLRAITTEDARQIVLPEVPPFPMVFEDLRPLSPSARDARLAHWGQLLARGDRPPDRWPLFDAAVLRLPDEHRVILAGRLLVFDGRSAEIFANDVKALYDGGRPLPPVGLTFADYLAELDGQAVNGDAGREGIRRSRAYWEARLDTLPPAPALPLRRVGAPATVQMQRWSARLDPDEWQALRAHAKALGVTPTVSICSAFCQVLARWSGTEHFTLNVMYGSRQPLHPAVNDIIGNFSDTLLVEVAAGGATLHEDAQALQRQMFADLQHANVSGVSTIRELVRRRGGQGPAPLMPVVFASGIGLDLGAGDISQNGQFMERLGWTPVRSSIQTPQVLLDHQVVESRGGLAIQWDARQGLLAEGVADSMFRAYVELLRRMAAGGPELWRAPKGELDLGEQLVVRGKANATALALDSETVLQAGLLEQATNHPERIALIAGGREYSYGALLRWASQLAGTLRASGVALGEPVGVLLPKSAEQVAAVLAVLVAGAAYVPLSVDNPAERNRTIVEGCGIRRVLCSTHAPERGLEAQAGSIQLIPVSEPPASADPIDLRPARTSDPGALAYIIFTSGSTGVPKGVAISHRAAMNTIVDINRRFGVTERDRVLGVSELTFDLSVYDLFGTFLAGGTLVLPADDLAKNPIHLSQLMIQHGVTVWNTVPAFLEMIVEFALQRQPEALAALRLIMMSGDWVPVTLPERIRQVNGSARVIALGGATEASIWSNYFEIGTVESHWSSIPYGRPLANQSFHVLDQHLRSAPDWVAGELFIGGAGLALGYYRDEKATRARFIEHPTLGERLYRTGDWGRYWNDGTIEFLGRRDTQIKIRGHRIELGDIEAALRRHPNVREAAVVALGPPAQERRLVAFYVARDGGQGLEVETLRRFLGKQLPAYMVPGELRALDSLPLTANGKVNRRLLESAPVRGPAAGAAGIAPRNDREALVHRVWRDLLGIDGFGVADSFFDLGGHSITAIRMVNRLEQELGVRLPPTAVYENTTIEKLVGLLADSAVQPAQVAIPLKAGSPEAPPLFCVHPVGGHVFCYWTLSRLWSQGGVYGLQSQALGTKLPPDETVEAMAASYVAQVHSLQPAGPIRLLGWSMGGTIAVEMARLLRVAGREVRVVMLDPWVAEDGLHQPSDADLLRAYLNDLVGDSGAAAAVVADSASPEARLRAVHGFLRARKLLIGDAGIDQLKRLYDLFVINNRALGRYRPMPTDVPILLLAAEREKSERFPHLLPLFRSETWRRALPRLTHHQVAANHFTIVQEGVLQQHIAGIATFLQPGPAA